MEPPGKVGRQDEGSSKHTSLKDHNNPLKNTEKVLSHLLSHFLKLVITPTRENLLK